MATQAERRATTRGKLIDAAASVFAERGYHGATLDAIAERAGLSKGSVYHHFASKHVLFATLLGDRLEARLAEAPRPEDAAAAFLDRASDPRWAPLFFEFLAQAARDDDVREVFVAWLRDTRARLADLIAERLGGPPDEQRAVLVSALANGMLIEVMFDPSVPPELLGRGVELLASATGAGGGGSVPRRGA
ncbi:MAG TPA: helix-turn-helix domain-containing protein [Solirubrobacteraceae bacterium]|nr:helix-turn-helix domain-containing protein [Solirubrobacteraceae bacterium]